jgi:hypothetical protein
MSSISLMTSLASSLPPDRCLDNDGELQHENVTSLPKLQSGNTSGQTDPSGVGCPVLGSVAPSVGPRVGASPVDAQSMEVPCGDAS